MTSLGVVIPVYNEAENIGRTIDAIQQKVKTPHRIHIVYDFDEDNTLPVARAYLQEGVPLDFIRNPVRGVASAIKTGLRESKEEWLLVTMADLSDDYSVVDRMCGLMQQGCDLVCGARYMKGGRQIGGPRLKKLLSRCTGLSLKYLAGLPTHDATNSFKLYRKKMVDSFSLESGEASRWAWRSSSRHTFPGSGSPRSRASGPTGRRGSRASRSPSGRRSI